MASRRLTRGLLRTSVADVLDAVIEPPANAPLSGPMSPILRAICCAVAEYDPANAWRESMRHETFQRALDAALRSSDLLDLEDIAYVFRLAVTERTVMLRAGTVAIALLYAAALPVGPARETILSILEDCAQPDFERHLEMVFFETLQAAIDRWKQSAVHAQQVSELRERVGI